MRMSSIMRWRSGLIVWLGVVMARLSSNEADRLINQHRKPSGFPTKNHHVQTECIPRERFSPSTLSRRANSPTTDAYEASLSRIFYPAYFSRAIIFVLM
jgi:hypothetical protein